MSEFLTQFGNQSCLFSIPVVAMPMPYYNEEEILPLPPSPKAGFCTRLSLHLEVIDATLPKDVEVDPPTQQE